MEDNRSDSINWHETTGDPNWRQKVAEASTIDVPSTLQPHEQDLSDAEDSLYRSLLESTRTRQNGDYPGLG